MTSAIDRYFGITESGSSYSREILAGVTTFLAMCYIIFVQPVILGSVGMDQDALITVTCLSCAFATLLMGILAKYPIALAPAMGHNVLFAGIVRSYENVTWEIALGAVFISGAIFVFFSFFGLRERIMNAVPDGLKYAIAVGIGLLIAYIGLVYAGFIDPDPPPGVFVKLGNLGKPYCIAVAAAVLLIGVLLQFRFRGAVLAGMALVFVVGLLAGFIDALPVREWVAMPKWPGKTFMKLDIAGAFRLGFLDIIFVFFFLDLFDTIGTLIGVGERSGFLDKQGRLPRARQALLSDAVSTVGGAVLGTSTVTSYIESTTGISAGGRTGFANVATALLFILALFFGPLIGLAGGRAIDPESDPMRALFPVIAPALIVVGAFMMAPVRKIDWEDFSEAIPAFLCILIMPMAQSITDGIAFGFIAYAVVKALTGRWRKVNGFVYLFALLFLVRYVVMILR